ncbi:MAG: response regulator transcription factor [Nitrosomonadaceae bacterium]
MKGQRYRNNETISEPAELLIVDDDERICRSLECYLQHEGYTVSSVSDGKAMWKYYEDTQPDLILLDIMLPGVDGLTLARELRVKKPKIGIIMLTGKDDAVDTIVGLEVGADDYITKPFDNRELLARIHSVLRRLSANNNATKTTEDTENIVRFNGWQMNTDTFELIAPTGEKINLTSIEFKLLEILVHSVGRVLSRDQILQKLSSREWQPNDRSVDVLIGKLRKVIETNPAQPKLIRTIRNLGYQFTAKVNSK